MRTIIQLSGSGSGTTSVKAYIDFIAGDDGKQCSTDRLGFVDKTGCLSGEITAEGGTTIITFIQGDDLNTLTTNSAEDGQSVYRRFDGVSPTYWDCCNSDELS